MAEEIAQIPCDPVIGLPFQQETAHRPVWPILVSAIGRLGQIGDDTNLDHQMIAGRQKRIEMGQHRRCRLEGMGAVLDHQPGMRGGGDRRVRKTEAAFRARIPVE